MSAKSVSYLKAIGMSFALAAALTEKLANDGKIDPLESIEVMGSLCASSGLPFDSGKAGCLNDAMVVLHTALEDDKLTIIEVFTVAEAFCMCFDIEFDKAGIEL